MNLLLRPLVAEDLPDLLTWQYEPPYDVYNMGHGFVDGRVDETTLAKAVEYFLNPAYHFYSLVNADSGTLTAVVSYGLDGQVPGGDYREDALDIGFAVRPELTGQGLGSDFVDAVIEFAIHTFQPAQLRVTIADFNGRARRVWEKHGFQPISSFNSQATDMAFTIFTGSRKTSTQLPTMP
jgi:GNAT superfamily N-acetyltransferase